MRAKDAGCFVQVCVCVAVLEHVVAAGDDIHACGEDLVSGRGSDAAAGGGVLAICDDVVKLQFGAEIGHPSTDGFSAGAPDDVTEKKESHR